MYQSLHFLPSWFYPKKFLKFYLEAWYNNLKAKQKKKKNHTKKDKNFHHYLLELREFRFRLRLIIFTNFPLISNKNITYPQKYFSDRPVVDKNLLNVIQWLRFRWHFYPRRYIFVYDNGCISHVTNILTKCTRYFVLLIRCALCFLIYL